MVQVLHAPHPELLGLLLGLSEHIPAQTKRGYPLLKRCSRQADTISSVKFTIIKRLEGKEVMANLGWIVSSVLEGY